MDEPAMGGVVGDERPTGLATVAADCVHCGFCLPACPTYQLWGEEMDSPRGRIHLISQVLGGAPLTGSVVTHLDRCLGCMACLPACPSGVQYNVLIEAARAWTDDRDTGASPGAPIPAAGAARSLRDRAVRAAIFATFPYPRRMRVLTRPLRLAQRAGLDRRLQHGRAARWLPRELTAALRIAPRPGRRGAGRAPALPARIPAQGPRRAVVGLLTGCVQEVFFAGVNAATARVLAAEGCDVVIPPGQGCCGALSLHTGRAGEAARFARRTIEVFEQAGVDAVVLNSAGCGSAMKEYATLLAGPAAAGGTRSTAHTGGGAPTPHTPPAAPGQPPDHTGPGDEWVARADAFGKKVQDLSEFLAGLYERCGGPRAARHELAVTAVYHDACHLANAQRIRQQPRDLLASVPGLEVAEVGDGGTCCGSAGVYNLLQPEAAAELGRRKAAAIRATGARLIVSANPGCSLQIAAALAADGGAPVPVVHTAQVLDASFRGLPVSALGS